MYLRPSKNKSIRIQRNIRNVKSVKPITEHLSKQRGFDTPIDIASGFRVTKDVEINNIKISTRLPVPHYKNLSQVGGIPGEPGQEGQIIINRENKLFYGYDGSQWQYFANATIIKNIRSLIGYGTQVDIGAFTDFVNLNINVNAAPFIQLLEEFGFNVKIPPTFGNDDVKVLRRFQRIGNNIHVDGSISINIADLDSALYLLIIILQMIGLMPILNSYSNLILAVSAAFTFDINGVISAFQDIGNQITALFTNPLVIVPFKMPTISEKYLNDNSCVNVEDVQFIVHEDTFTGDCGGVAIVDGVYPYIGYGSYYKLPPDQLAKSLQDLLNLPSNSIPDSIVIPTSIFSDLINDSLSLFTDGLNAVLAAFASAINAVIIDPINDIINVINDLLSPDPPIPTLDDVSFGTVADPPTINIPDVEIPLNGIPIVDIVNSITNMISQGIRLITMILGTKDISFSISASPGDMEISLNMFGPVAVYILKSLYNVMSNVISIISAALGNLKIPLDIVKSFTLLIVLVLQIFVFGESHFSYSYRCDPDQIPGINSPYF